MMITIILQYKYFFANGLCFARMHRPARLRSKGSRFTLRVWGFRVCSLEVAQPSAPSSCEVATAGKSGHCSRFQMSRNLYTVSTYTTYFYLSLLNLLIST